MNSFQFRTFVLHRTQVLSKYLSEKVNMLNSQAGNLLCLSVLQIALIDLLTKIGLQPDGIIGHSVGELACGYADGSLSHSEAILAAYWRGHCIKEANLPPGGMAAVGKDESIHSFIEMEWNVECACLE